MVTLGRLLGADLTTGLGVDTVATPVTVDPDIGHLIHAGDRVDLVATPRPDMSGPDGSGAQAGRTPHVAAMLVARRAQVLAVVDASAVAIGPIGTEIVLATDRILALRIAGLRNTRTFAVVGDSP